MGKKKAKGFFGTVVSLSTAGLVSGKSANKVVEVVKKNANTRNAVAIALAPKTGGFSLTALQVKGTGTNSANPDYLENNAAGVQGFSQAVGTPLDPSGQPQYYVPVQQSDLAQDNFTSILNGSRGLQAITKGA